MDKKIHPHESPWLMTVPLIVLGVLSVIGGWVGIPHVIGEVLPWHPLNNLEHWLEPVLKVLPAEGHADPSLEWGLMATSLTLALISASIAYHFYVRNPALPKKMAESLGGFYRLVYQKYLVDELYNKIIINPLVRGSQKLWAVIDVKVINRATYVVSDLVRSGGGVVRSIQSGNLQMYAMYFGLGLILTLALILMR